MPMHAPAQTLYDLLNMIDLIHSDAVSALPRLEPESFDAVITDPPYSSVAVSGSASWHYDPNEASASGSIDAEFTVSLQDQTIEL